MHFVNKLNNELNQKHLLKHPWYQAWTAGQLNVDYLKDYACQYFHHVNAFPRYISATHTNCDDLASRQVLLENLTEEEHGSNNHPELWLRFAEGLGVTREQVKKTTLLPETKNLIDTFLSLAKSSYAEGVGALYAYERQNPDIAATKAEGLKKFYGISDERTLRFFTVHHTADIEHSQDTQELIEKMSNEDKQKAKAAAHKIADALWDFLSGVQKVTMGKEVSCH